MSTENRKFLAKRLEALKDHYLVTYGDLADIIGIARSMLDFLRFEKKDAGPKVMRKIIEAERAAGLAPPPPQKTPPRAVEFLPPPPSGDKKAREAELRAIRDELAKLSARVNRLLNE